MFTSPKGPVNVPFPLNWMPAIRVFGTGFPPKYWYPSKVHRYKPRSIVWLQFAAPGAGPAVADVPSGTVATRLANAHAKSEQLAILLASFVFMIVVSFCLVFVVVAVIGFSS